MGNSKSSSSRNKMERQSVEKDESAASKNEEIGEETMKDYSRGKSPRKRCAPAPDRDNDDDDGDLQMMNGQHSDNERKRICKESDNENEVDMEHDDDTEDADEKTATTESAQSNNKVDNHESSDSESNNAVVASMKMHHLFSSEKDQSAEEGIQQPWKAKPAHQDNSTREDNNSGSEGDASTRNEDAEQEHDNSEYGLQCYETTPSQNRRFSLRKSRSLFRKTKSNNTGVPPTTVYSSFRKYEYHCPIDDCPEIFAFQGDHEPPLEDDGERVSDKVRWPRKFFSYQIQQCRQHMRDIHPGIPEEFWPHGFGLLNLTVARSGEDEYFYQCPYVGCQRTFGLRKELNPPLNKEGMVSDNERWDPKFFGSRISFIRKHLRTMHPDAHEGDWPIALKRFSSQPQVPSVSSEKGVSYEYVCPVTNCRKEFLFSAKDHSLPLTSSGEIADDRIWSTDPIGPVRTVQRHLQNYHPVFPEHLWPTAFKQQTQEVDEVLYCEYQCPVDDCQKIIEFAHKRSDFSKDEDPWNVIPIRRHMESHPAFPKEHLPPMNVASSPLPGGLEAEFAEYLCPIDGCPTTFRFETQKNPPLDRHGHVRDDEWWGSDTFNRQVDNVRRHIRREHADFEENEWPVGFAYRRGTNSGLRAKDSYAYTCPVDGCTNEFLFAKDQNPPLDEEGNVSDKIPWGQDVFRSHVQRVRTHMRSFHKDVEEQNWPAGFAYRYLSIDYSDSESYAYPCPIENCEKVFDFPAYLEPPLTIKGIVSDQVRWEHGRFRAMISKLRYHMTTFHPFDLAEEEWPKGFARAQGEENRRYHCPVGGCGQEFNYTGSLLTQIHEHFRINHADIPEADWPAGFALGSEPRMIKTDTGLWFYGCPVKHCEHAFKFLTEHVPPLDSAGHVSDQIPWAPGWFKSQLGHVRRHMRSRHGNIPENDWPPGFSLGFAVCKPVSNHSIPSPTATRLTPSGISNEKSDMYVYCCPVDGCTKKTYFPREPEPPLDDKGMVSDKEPWTSSVFKAQLENIRYHVRSRHQDLAVDEWPLGFALKNGRRRSAHAHAADHVKSQQEEVNEDKDDDDDEDDDDSLGGDEVLVI